MPPGATGTPAASGSALATARQLPVKGRAPMTGYSRRMFGDGWIDTDHNGCDTRNDILARDLTGVAFRPGTHHCIVVSGTLRDPYTGATIHFVRGVRTSNEVQIDHIVALGDAWQKGAQRWPADRRVAFANDPLNLLAVDGRANQEKGDGDAATWLPPNRAFRCDYVARQVAVKRKYGLWVTSAEQAAMVRVLTSCPGR
ncbi:MAG TPA: HNH endonuclease family protein [Propionibacteriaceae bacterium]|nr:HNH endonuclease family protein [Propionibacteriaceae bacterium]